MSNGILTGFDRWSGRNPWNGRTAPLSHGPGPRKDGQSPRPAWLDSILDENAGSPICLTDSLVHAVFRHLAMNGDPLYAADMPQILILNGRFGVGKTVGLDETLNRCGCGKIRIQASELESHLAGVPAQLICARYVEASAKQDEENVPYTLIIEDIHLAFGVDANTYKTTNTQLAVAALMGICDDPYLVRGKETQRIPIFATANDLSNVYGGLLRPGRTRVFAVELSESERQRIVSHIFQGFLTDEQAAHLCAARPTWPIAAFRQLKSELLYRAFDSRHHGRAAREILQFLTIQAAKGTTGRITDVSVDQKELDQAILAIDREAEAKRDFTNETAPS